MIRPHMSVLTSGSMLPNRWPHLLGSGFRLHSVSSCGTGTGIASQGQDSPHPEFNVGGEISIQPYFDLISYVAWTRWTATFHACHHHFPHTCRCVDKVLPHDDSNCCTLSRHLALVQCITLVLRVGYTRSSSHRMALKSRARHASKHYLQPQCCIPEIGGPFVVLGQSSLSVVRPEILCYG